MPVNALPLSGREYEALNHHFIILQENLARNVRIVLMTRACGTVLLRGNAMDAGGRHQQTDSDG